MLAVTPPRVRAFGPISPHRDPPLRGGSWGAAMGSMVLSRPRGRSANEALTVGNVSSTPPHPPSTPPTSLLVEVSVGVGIARFARDPATSFDLNHSRHPTHPFVRHNLSYSASIQTTPRGGAVSSWSNPLRGDAHHVECRLLGRAPAGGAFAPPTDCLSSP